SPCHTVTFLYGLDRAEFQPRCPARFPRGHSGPDVVFRLQVDVQLNFFREIRFASVVEQGIAKPQKKLPEMFHSCSSPREEKRAMISLVFCHSRSSAASSFLPCLVMR